MGAETSERIRTLGLFQKRIEGDDALMELARQRFRAAGLGAEIYADSRAELERLLRFRPAEQPVALHLKRGLDLFDPRVRREIAAIAREFRGEVFGIIAHDQAEIPERFEGYLSVLGELDRELSLSPGGPVLFIEYAVGLDREVFVRVFERAKDLGGVSACIDIGHLAIQHARLMYAHQDPDRDLCSSSPTDPSLPDRIDRIQAAVGGAVEAVLSVIGELSALERPLHYHLHDCHPLSTASPFGIADHLSFLGGIDLPFSYHGAFKLPLMFGPQGLARVLTESLKNPSRLSYSLEIHPTGHRMPLGNASSLFDHWTDKTNAEKMNHWLSVLEENHRLLFETLRTLTDPTVKTGQG